MSKNHCDLCKDEFPTMMSWWNIPLKNGEEKKVCFDCMWQALSGGYKYIKSIEKSIESHGDYYDTLSETKIDGDDD